ncbi:hypothetical protein D1871_02130 [Nakamurella silvestris]|nr:hypothetical protein D1871_02130 [Nakamurella silvestris]
MPHAHRPVRRRISDLRALVVCCVLACLLAPRAADAAAVPLAKDLQQQVPSGRHAADEVTPSIEEIRSAEIGASTESVDTGKPVEVDLETTGTSRVTAEPDGTYLLETSREPVRVQRNGSWIPVDSSLTVDPEGTVSPVATAVDVAFSGGGTGPLITLTAPDGRTLTYSWPGSLPTPVISGNAATYPAVLPGVDLVVTAEPTSYSEVLVVRTPEAAQNPALTILRLSLDASGLTLVPGGDSGSTFRAVDPDGHTVFDSERAIMWDSTTGTKAGPAPSAVDPGSGDVDVVDVQFSTTGEGTGLLQLSPPTAALTGPDVEYPVYIDPVVSVASGHFADVFNNGWDYFDNHNYNLQVGYCGWPGCDGIGTGRAYFAFSSAALINRPTTARIIDASVYVRQVHAGAGCTAEPVSLMRTSGPISAGTTWPGPATSLIQTVSKGGGDSCPQTPAGNIVFDNAALTAYFQGVADSDQAVTTFGLKAPDENEKMQWKRFDTSPTLDVHYSFPTSQPVANGISGAVSCGGKNLVTDSSPTLRGSAKGNNTDDPGIALAFAVFHAGAADPTYSSGWKATTSGTVYGWSAPALAQGNWEYQVRAKSNPGDGNDVEQAIPSKRYPFTVDTAPPSGTPTVVSRDYPEGTWGAPQNLPGMITIGAGGADNVVGFAYSWTDAGSILVPNAQDCGNYTGTHPLGGLIDAVGGEAKLIPPKTLDAGPRTLFVRSFDNAHNLSAAVAAYPFYVSPTVPGATPVRTEAENVNCIKDFGPHGLGSLVVDEAYDDAGGGMRTRFVATGGDPADGPTIRLPFTAGVSADYALGIALYRGNHFGKVQFSVDDGADAVPLINSDTGDPITFDGYSPTQTRVYQPLGGLHLTAGNHTLAITVVGKNAQSVNANYNGVNDHGYSTLIDLFMVIPIDNVSASSFQAALNNNGISRDGVNTADIGPSSGNSSLSMDTLEAKGFGVGQTKVFDGASFTMPAANSNGNDNVIATGQTIPLTPVPNANNVDLLVTATCGAIPASFGLQASIKYAASPVSDRLVPALPAWTDAAPGDLPHVDDKNYTLYKALTLPYRNVGLVKVTGSVTLYHLRLPTNGGGTIAGVTLPSTGTDLTDTCQPAVHVLSVTTSHT